MATNRTFGNMTKPMSVSKTTMSADDMNTHPKSKWEGLSKSKVSVSKKPSKWAALKGKEKC